MARAHCSLSAGELPLEAMWQVAFDVPLSIRGDIFASSALQAGR